MKSICPRFKVGCLLILGSMVQVSTAHAQTLINVGDFGGGFSDAAGINNFGQVVGDSTSKSGDFAYLYSNGTLTNLGTIGGFYINAGTPQQAYVNSSKALGINDAGQVVGQSTTSNTDGNSDQVAFLYSQGQMTGVAAGPNSEALSINNSGKIVGIETLASGEVEGFLYSSGGITNVGGPASFASHINAAGQVVGYANGQAFLYANGVTTILGSLPGGSSGAARAINDSGQIVGSDFPANFNESVPVSFQNGQAIRLGNLPGYTGTYEGGIASSINATGQVVGFVQDQGVTQDDAFLYTSNVGVQNLNVLYSSLLVSGNGAQTGFTHLDLASGINNLGQIVGNGDYWNGQKTEIQGYILTPQSAPEPHSWMLGLIGGGLFLYWRNYRRSV